MSSRTSQSACSLSSFDPIFQNPDPIEETDLRSMSHPTFASSAISCTLTPDDLSLIRMHYGVPLEYELELPRPNDRACSPLSDRFCLYLEALHARLKLPLPSFVVALFHFLNISLAFVVLNSFRFVIGFLSLCHLAEVRPTISLFKNYYIFKHHPSTKDWWYFFS